MQCDTSKSGICLSNLVWAIDTFKMLYNCAINFLVSGLVTYLSIVHHVHSPPNFYWFCTAGNLVFFTSFLCSTLLIVSMAFDRFYSIIRPHKAASFNTVKRAKIIIVCIALFSILYNIPHLFISAVNGRQCLPYGAALGKFYGQFYHWLSLVFSFALPFALADPGGDTVRGSISLK